MIVAIDPRRQLSARKSVNDLQVGDLVRRKGHRGVGLVETAAEGFAWVAWSDERRDYLPFVALRKVRAGGSDFDTRKKL